MTLLVEIIEEDIREGQPGTTTGCPGNRAIRRSRRNLGFVDGILWVSDMNVSFNGLCYELPLKAQSFVRRFDAGKEVQPMSFQMEAPDE